MADPELQDGDEISLFAVGTTLLRNWRRIARWMFVGAFLAALMVVAKPKLYRANASFISQATTDPGVSGLASIAGQFGVSIPASSQSSLSPEFYSEFLTSRVLLQPIVRDTFRVPELEEERISFLELFEVEGETEARRLEDGVKALRGMISVEVVRTTGVVSLAVSTEWPSVSLAIADALVDGVNEFNQRTRQGQAIAERKFVEGRLEIAAQELREAENRLEEFLTSNRQFNSPELEFTRDRLRREVTSQQQMYSALEQSYEEARIREVRDTPVITVVEPPAVPTRPQPRGRLKTTLVGLILGGLIGVILSLTSGLLDRRQAEGDEQATLFATTWRDVKRELFTPRQWFRRRA